MSSLELFGSACFSDKKCKILIDLFSIKLYEIQEVARLKERLDLLFKESMKSWRWFQNFSPESYHNEDLSFWISKPSSNFHLCKRCSGNSRSYRCFSYEFCNERLLHLVRASNNTQDSQTLWRKSAWMLLEMSKISLNINYVNSWWEEKEITF